MLNICLITFFLSIIQVNEAELGTIIPGKVKNDARLPFESRMWSIDAHFVL